MYKMLESDIIKLSFVSNLQEVISYLLLDLNLTEADKLQTTKVRDTFRGYISRLEQVRDLPEEDNSNHEEARKLYHTFHTIASCSVESSQF